MVSLENSANIYIKIDMYSTQSFPENEEEETDQSMLWTWDYTIRENRQNITK